MPAFLAFLVPMFAWIGRIIVGFLIQFFSKKVFFRIAGLVALFSAFEFVFVPFLVNMASSFISGMPYIQDVISSMSLFVPSNFSTCISIICSTYILIFIFSWKVQIIKIFGG